MRTRCTIGRVKRRKKKRKKKRNRNNESRGQMSCQISVPAKLPAVSGTIARISMKEGGLALYLRAITRRSFLRGPRCLLLFRFQSSLQSVCHFYPEIHRFFLSLLDPPAERNSFFSSVSFFLYFLPLLLSFFFFFSLIVWLNNFCLDRYAMVSFSYASLMSFSIKFLI